MSGVRRFSTIFPSITQHKGVTLLSCPYTCFHHPPAQHTITTKSDGTFYLQLLKNDTLGVRGTTKRLNLELDTQGALLVGFVGPAVDTAGRLQLARGMETSRLALAYTNRSVNVPEKDGWIGRV